MRHDQQSQLCAQTKQNEAVFFIGMIGIGDKPSELISKDRPRFFKGDAMFTLIDGVLGLVPFES